MKKQILLSETSLSVEQSVEMRQGSSAGTTSEIMIWIKYNLVSCEQDHKLIKNKVGVGSHCAVTISVCHSFYFHWGKEIPTL